MSTKSKAGHATTARKTSNSFDVIKDKPFTEAEEKLMALECVRESKLARGWNRVRELVRIKRDGNPLWVYYVVYFPAKGCLNDSTTLVMRNDAEAISVASHLRAANAKPAWI